MKLNPSICIILLSALIGISGCQTSTVSSTAKPTYESKLSSEPVLVQNFSVEGNSEQEVKDAIWQAANNRGWEVHALDSGDIQTKLIHRGYDSTLTFKYESGFVSIYSVSYEIDKKTQHREKRGEPEGWIRNLQKDILSILGIIEG